MKLKSCITAFAISAILFSCNNAVKLESESTQTHKQSSQESPQTQSVTDSIENPVIEKQIEKNIDWDKKIIKTASLKLEVKKAEKIKELYRLCKTLVPSLKLSNNAVRYYGSLSGIPSFF